jgi:hypothetical protein
MILRLVRLRVSALQVRETLDDPQDTYLFGSSVSAVSCAVWFADITAHLNKGVHMLVDSTVSKMR